MGITSLNFETYVSGSWNWNAGSEDQKDTGIWKSGIWIRSDTMDVSGGKITKQEIDRLSEYEDKRVLTISGLNQETFEYFIEKFGKELRAVRFFKNKMVEDWSLLSELPELEYVYWFFNQRITSLWDMSGNRKLKGLCLSDFSRLHTLEGIAKAPNLEWFSIGNEVWDKAEVDSYCWFAGTHVKYLDFSGKKILDEDLSFLSDMPDLKIFDFAPSLFSTEQIAWVMANFPEIKGRSFQIFLDDWIYNKATADMDIPALCLTGKGQRKFPASDVKKKEKLQREFLQLMEQYRGAGFDAATLETVQEGKLWQS